MSHDKVKAAVRARMAQTGEPYATARRWMALAAYGRVSIVSSSVLALR